MKIDKLEKIFSRISLIGAARNDTEETRIHKSLLVICAFLFMFTGAAWGIMYILFGELLAALIPLSYFIISLGSIIQFGITRNYQVFRFLQLMLILVLPFALMLVLGGFISGSIVIIWSLLSPLGAMLFAGQTKAPRWLVAFVILVAISGIVESWVSRENNLTPVQINLFFVINLAGVGSLIFLMVYYFATKKNFFQARSEALLLNILPRQIAEELKTKGSVEAKQFNSVTVMFTDFKNFTKISEALSPSELVSEIDYCFKAFDNIINRYNIEKIKTIGDSYMCAGGLPLANATHATDILSAAMEIQKFVEQHSCQKMDEHQEQFEIRIGVHTGPVVAGIVGVKKFAYDIWGDTVNIASRMESSGEAGKINISGSTYELVKEKFNCVHRGKIQAKNKGMIDMYFVES